ncbi:MAG TPA: hypothetical protein VD928_03025 [Candidatus Paceibacterota bacterium]|nr:hypothetical protein [Candidatus Paceibacterota bacterium]
MHSNDTAGKVKDLKNSKGEKMRKPFTPDTGNPENGNYADWHDALRDGTVVSLSTQKK